MPTVQLPDGRTVAFPEGMTPEQMKAALGKFTPPPKAEAAPTSNPLLRFGGSYAKSMFGTTVKPLLDLGGEVIRRGGPVVAAPGMARDMFKGAQAASQEQFQKGMESEGPESMGHFAAGALPMVGPAAAGVGEEAAGQFQRGDIAGGMGTGAGGMLGLILPMLLGARGTRRSGEAPGPPAPPSSPGVVAPKARPPMAPAVPAPPVPQTPAALPAAGAVSRRAFLGKAAGAAAAATTKGPAGIAQTVLGEAAPAASAVVSAADWVSRLKKLDEAIDAAPQDSYWRYDRGTSNNMTQTVTELLDGALERGKIGKVHARKVLADAIANDAGPEGSPGTEIGELAEGLLRDLNQVNLEEAPGLLIDAYSADFGADTFREVRKIWPKNRPLPKSVESFQESVQAPPQPAPPQAMVPQAPPKVPPQVTPGQGPTWRNTRTPSSKFNPADLPPQFEGEFDSRGTAGPLPPKRPSPDNILERYQEVTATPEMMIHKGRKWGMSPVEIKRGIEEKFGAGSYAKANANYSKWEWDAQGNLIRDHRGPLTKDGDTISGPDPSLPLQHPGEGGAFFPQGQRTVAVQRVHNMMTVAFDRIKKRAAKILDEPEIAELKLRLDQNSPTGSYSGKRNLMGGGRRDNLIRYDPISMARSFDNPRDWINYMVQNVLEHEPAHSRGVHDWAKQGAGQTGKATPHMETSRGVMAEVEPDLYSPRQGGKHTRETQTRRSAISPEEHRLNSAEDIMAHDPEVQAVLSELRRNLEKDPSLFRGMHQARVMGSQGGPASTQGPSAAPPAKPPQTPGSPGGGEGGTRPARQAARLPRVPYTLAERTGSPGAAFAERALESSFPSAKPFKKLRTAQQEALQSMSKAVVEDISKFKGSPEELGQEWQKSTKVALEGLKSEAAESYSQVDEIAKGVKPSTSLPKAFAKDTLKAMKAESKLVPPKELQRMQDILGRVSKAPDRVTFRQMADARSTLLSIGRERGVGALSGKAGGALKKLTQAMDQAMEDAAKTKPGLLEKFREVNSKWRDIHETFDRSVVAKMMEAAPEKIPSYLRGASLEDVDRLARVTPPETWDAIRAKVVEGIFETATEGEGARFAQLKSMLTGTHEPPAVKMRPGKLRKILEDQYGHEKLKRMFKDRPDALSNVFKVLEEADKVGHSQSSLLGSFINARILWKTGGAILSGEPSQLLEPAMIALTARTASKLMTRAWGANVLKNYLAVSQIAKETPKTQFWLARFNEAMDKAEKNDKDKELWKKVETKAGFDAGMKEEKK